MVDRVGYDDAAPWPDVSVSHDSLHRTSIDTFGDAASSWTDATPTPGSVELDDPTPRVVGVGATEPVRGATGVIGASTSGLVTLDVYFNVPQSQLGSTKIFEVGLAGERTYTSDGSSLTQRGLALNTPAANTWL